MAYHLAFCNGSAVLTKSTSLTSRRYKFCRTSKDTFQYVSMLAQLATPKPFLILHDTEDAVPHMAGISFDASLADLGASFRRLTFATNANMPRCWGTSFQHAEKQNGSWSLPTCRRFGQLWRSAGQCCLLLGMTSVWSRRQEISRQN